MSLTLATLNKLTEDMLYDEQGNPKYKQEIKWKSQKKHKDTYEAYEIPFHFEDFIKDFGGIEHPKETDKITKLPVMVTELADYQRRFAKLDYGVALKSNKIGMTTSELLGDFHTRINLPETAGNDCLFSTAASDISNMLLNSLKYNVQQSPKYRQFMLKKSQRPESTEEAAMHRMIIANPYRDGREGKILALGTSLSTTFSKMNVNRVHISDPSKLTIKKQDMYFSGLFSRLANTGGQIKIEGVPGDRTGWFYKLCYALFPNLHGDADYDETEDNSGKDDDVLSDYEFPPEIRQVFSTSRITIDDAVDANVIPAETRELYRKSMSPAEYRRTYMAEFPPDENAVFGPADNIGEHKIEW